MSYKRHASTSLALTYVAVALTGAADAVCQGSLFGVVAPMPERFTQALMGGTSFSGLVVSALRVVFKAAFAGSADGARGGAVAYFAVSALWVGACLGIFAHLERAPVFQYHRRKHARERARESDRGDRGDCAPLSGEAYLDETLSPASAETVASTLAAALREEWKDRAPAKWAALRDDFATFRARYARHVAAADACLPPQPLGEASNVGRD